MKKKEKIENYNNIKHKQFDLCAMLWQAFIDELETEIDSFDFLNGELCTLLAL